MFKMDLRNIILLVALTICFVWTNRELPPPGCRLKGGFFKGDSDVYCIGIDLHQNYTIRLMNNQTEPLTILQHLELFQVKGEISDTTFELLQNLKGLTIRDSVITKFQVPKHLDNLESLIIINSSMPLFENFDCCKNLKNFLAMTNNISLVDKAFHDKKHLELLYLANLNIRKLHRSLFETLKFLKILQIASTVIEEIDEDAFEGIPKLKILRLNLNNTNTLKQNTFKSLKNLEELEILAKNMEPLTLDLFEEQKHIRSVAMPTNTYLNIDTDKFLSHFPNLKSYSFSRDWSPEYEEKMEEILKKLSSHINKPRLN